MSIMMATIKLIFYMLIEIEGRLMVIEKILFNLVDLIDLILNLIKKKYGHKCYGPIRFLDLEINCISRWN